MWNRPHRSLDQSLTLPGHEGGEEGPGSPSGGGGGGGGGQALTAAERNAAFSRFKKELDEGRSLHSLVLERSAHLAELKRSVKEVAGSVNAAKQEIDAATLQLGMKKSLAAATTASAEEGILDSEQYALLRDLKAAKLRCARGPGCQCSVIHHPPPEVRGGSRLSVLCHSPSPS